MNEGNRSSVRSTLVLGIGNILLRDDGVGVRVVEALQNAGVPDCVEVVDGGTAGADLVDIVADRERLIVVDAVEAGEEPGTIVALGAGDLLPEDGPVSLHQFGLAETLSMARLLGCAPGETIVLGVQPGRVTPGLALTEAVAQAVPGVVDIVLGIVEQTATARPS